MTDLFAARSQMAMSLAFHMVFATVGIGMPLLMVVAEAQWLRTREEGWLQLAKAWSKGTAVMFAVGAVSGTVLSFELGLLWPGFMEFAGPIIGMPFSLEGFAFFFEAIFLGVYLYGWNAVSERAHLLAGVGVLVSGTLSGIFVVCANAWMNAPTGFELDAHGAVLSIDPVAAMLNPHAFGQALHMTVAAFLATSFGVAGVHAFMLRRQPGHPFPEKALRIALAVGIVSTFAQPATGHFVGEAVAHHQPVKFAALEGLWEDHPQGAPFMIGGIPDEVGERTDWGIEIPYLLSLVAFQDPTHPVAGLKSYPKADRPPVLVTHLAYQLMLASAGVLGGTGAIGLVLWGWRKRVPDDPWYLALVVFAAPWGMIGIEAGWTATEVGRQPWVVHGILRTADAVSPMPNLQVPFFTFSLLYAVLAVAVVALLRRQFVVHTPAWDGSHDG
jgi:cytochrome d ubiquinol oxidase subunit I